MRVLVSVRQVLPEGTVKTAMRESTVLDGRDSALLVGVLFALAHWPFERPSAKALLAPALRAAGLASSDDLSDRWRGRLAAIGLWHAPSGQWTPDLIGKRAALEQGLEISELDVELSLLALELAKIEFADNWDEFCTAIPGALDWYGLSPSDLDALANKLAGVQGVQ